MADHELRMQTKALESLVKKVEKLEYNLLRESCKCDSSSLGRKLDNVESLLKQIYNKIR